MVAKNGAQLRPPILIVGAGVSGLQTARALLKRGFQVVLIEQSEDVSGVWIRNFQGYGLQVPWELYQFPEFPYPRKSELADYPSGDAVRDYVQAYARHFDLYRHILFSCRLVSLRRKVSPPQPQQPAAPPAKAQEHPLMASQRTTPFYTVLGFGARSGAGGDGSGNSGVGGRGGGVSSAAAGNPALAPNGRCGSTTQHLQRTFMGPFPHAADDGGDGREGHTVPAAPPPGCGRRVAASGGGYSACSGECSDRVPTACPGAGVSSGPSGLAPCDEAMCRTFSGSYSTVSRLAAAAAEGAGAVDAETPPPPPPPPPPGMPPAQARTLSRFSVPGFLDVRTTAGRAPSAAGSSSTAAAAAVGAEGVRAGRERAFDAAAASCSAEGGKGPAASTATFPDKPQQGRRKQGEEGRQRGCDGLLDGVWEAVYEDSSTGRQYALDASYVVLCTGLYATPFIPTIPGQELYWGLQVHSRDFTDAGVATGKRVLVVGAGKTAMDVVTELTASSQAAAVTLLYRRPRWPLPRFAGNVSLKFLAYTRLMTAALLPHYYTAGPAARTASTCLTPLRKAFWVRLMGRVNQALGVKKTLGTPARPIFQDIWYSGQVVDAAKWPAIMNNPKVQVLQGELGHFTPVSAVLQDGTELQPDIVLYATGYSNHYTFLEPAARAALNVQHDGLYLYRHCLAPGLEGLAFVGAEVSTFNNILTAALQAEWLAAVLSGDVVLPGAQALAADVAAQQAWRRRIMPPHKLRGSAVMLYMQCYHDQLLEDMGLPTRRKKPSWRRPLAECLEPYTAMDYAEVFQRHPAPASPAAASPAAAQRLPTATGAHRGVVRQKGPRMGVPEREDGGAAGAAATAAEACAAVSTPTALAGSGPGGGGGEPDSPGPSAAVISPFVHSAAAGVGSRKRSDSGHMAQCGQGGAPAAVAAAACPVGVNASDMSEQDTLLSLESLPPALQAFRRTSVRVSPPAEDHARSRRRRSAVEPCTLLPPAASSAISGCAQQAFSFARVSGATSMAMASGFGGGGDAVVSPTSGRAAMLSLSLPGPGGGRALARASPEGGGGSSANRLPPQQSSATGAFGLPSGPDGLLLWAAGGSRQRSTTIGVSAVNSLGEPAAAAAAAASEEPRGSTRQGLVTELRSDSVASSGGCDRGSCPSYRFARRGFSLATLLSRNRSDDMYEASSSRMEPSSAAVLELAYKVLPPRHVEEALAASAAVAAARDKRLSTGGTAARTAMTPPPPQPAPPVVLPTSSPRPSGADAGVLRPPVPVTRPPTSPGSAPKPWPPPPREAPPTRPPPLPWGPATTDTNVVSDEGMLLGALNLSPMAAALPQGLLVHSVAASSSISYMPSCSTTSLPQRPDALAQAAPTAHSFTALYSDSQFCISSQAPTAGSPAVGTCNTSEIAAGVAAGVETGPDSVRAEPGPVPQVIVVYAARGDCTCAIREDGSAGGVSSAGGGGAAAATGGCGGVTAWVAHEPADRGTGAGSPRCSSSSSSGVSYMPTCSTVGPS